MTAITSCLFSWKETDALSDIQRLTRVLNYLPDERIIEALEAKRGKGRNEYPVRAMWRALLAGVVFQHRSIKGLIRELRRNPFLLELCGFNPLPLQHKPIVSLIRDPLTGKMKAERQSSQQHDTIPNEWNVYRFLRKVESLEAQQGLISEMMLTLREKLMAELPDFGQHLGYDGKAVQSHSTGRVSRETARTSDPDADWGKHETRGIDAKTGKPWTHVKKWFGYGLHLIADTKYEIPVAFEMTPASHSESKVLSGMVADLFAQTPLLAQRCKDFSADRGLDQEALKAQLWDEYGIRPLIDTRELWREEKKMPNYDPAQPITRPLYPERADNIIYSEKGQVFCVCPKTQEQRPLCFQGFESDRNTLKYRCPAAAYGMECQGKDVCYRQAGGNVGEYGRIIRINITEQNRRIFTPTPYGSPSWTRGYNRRSALERINSRLDQSYGFEDHFIRGQSSIKAKMGLCLSVMMTLGLASIKEGQPELMRSLVGTRSYRSSG